MSAFLYFDFSFMVWTLPGVLGAQIAAPESLNLTAQQKYFMASVPIFAGGVLRLAMGLLVDRIGAKTTGIIAQFIVITGLACGWILGLKSYFAVLAMGAMLGVAGASFANRVAVSRALVSAQMQGLVLGFSRRRHIGVVIDALLAPRLAAIYGWNLNLRLA